MRRRAASLALFPGSFDPITNGHLDIVHRSLSVFDEVIVAILVNRDKNPLFTVEERVAIIRQAFDRQKRVRVDTFEGLLVDYAARVRSSVIIRGLRAISDFEYELEMAQLNRRQDPEVESVYLMAGPQYSFLSSSGVKELATFGGKIDDLVPAEVARRLQEELTR